MLVLSQQDLTGLLDPLHLINAVEAALHAMSAGSIIMPKRLHLEWRENRLLAMPAVGEHSCAIKSCQSCQETARGGLLVTNGLMILNEGATGLPLVLMNAAPLTAQRTGAVGALGAEVYDAADTSSVGIVGSGVQGAGRRSSRVRFARYERSFVSVDRREFRAFRAHR